MAENRDQLEQQAMLLLQKDKKEEAVEIYLKILKLTKGDIRVRQKPTSSWHSGGSRRLSVSSEM